MAHTSFATEVLAEMVKATGKEDMMQLKGDQNEMYNLEFLWMM